MGQKWAKTIWGGAEEGEAAGFGVGGGKLGGITATYVAISKSRSH